MPDLSETLRDLRPRLERFEREALEAAAHETRRSSFEALCARYSALAREAGEALGRPFPVRAVREDDFGLRRGIALPAAVRELAGLAADLKAAVRRAIDARSSTADALPCPKAAGRPCQMSAEIDPNRFAVFFAIPFRNPSTCRDACDALIEWLAEERKIDGNRIFRADQWTYSGDFVCKICKAIQESRLVVADVTGGNPNVFFELGLAIGLGKPAILIHDEKATEGKVPSDLLAWEYVPYDGRSPESKEWLEHFGVVFDGTRRRG
jgi:hypothetical protein